MYNKDKTPMHMAMRQKFTSKEYLENLLNFSPFLPSFFNTEILIINIGIFLVKYPIYPQGYTWNSDFMRKDSAELCPERQDSWRPVSLRYKVQRQSAGETVPGTRESSLG